MEEELDDLRGRIVALELLMAGVIAKAAAERYEEPVAALQRELSEMKASLQLPSRTTDDRSERAWESTIETLERAFANAAGRLAKGFR